MHLRLLPAAGAYGGTYEATDARERVMVELAPEYRLLARRYWRQSCPSTSQVTAFIQSFDQPLRRLPIQIYC